MSDDVLYIGDDPARKDSMQHNYMKKLKRLEAEGKITAGVHQFSVLHDDWCNIHRGGYCNCDPDIVIKRKG